jgi:hypothetical protein
MRCSSSCPYTGASWGQYSKQPVLMPFSAADNGNASIFAFLVAKEPTKFRSYDFISMNFSLYDIYEPFISDFSL